MLIREITLVGLLALIAGAWQLQPSSFHISIIDGEGALNNVQGRIAREPVIQVEDHNRKPLAGAYVEFDSPSTGPGAVFSDGTTHFATTTDAYGRAVASGLRSNGVRGPYQISVHVSFQGQPIGEVTIHQTNVPPNVANISSNLQGSKATQTAEVALAASVLGVALGDQFLVNGASTLGNANLLAGTRLQTGASAATLLLHDNCEFLVGPHSSVLLSQPHLVVLQTGAARARHFGDCKLEYGGMFVTPAAGDADGVLAISGGSMEVASIDGNLQVLNTAGTVVATVTPGSVSTFATATAANGASASAATVPARDFWLAGAGLAGALVGLGVAADAVAQSSSSPTSP